MVRGAYRRTAQRIEGALVKIVAAGLIAWPLAGPVSAELPTFVSGFNAFGLTAVGSHAVPTLGDLDGDGDLDAMIGNGSGSLTFIANAGTASMPVFTTPATTPFGLADVGTLAAPSLADLDGDGDLDLLAGDYYGNLLFFANTGTPTIPAFAAPTTNSFGLADVGPFHAAPSVADLDHDGDLDILVGKHVGTTVFFTNTGTNTAPAFAAPVTNPFGLTIYHQSGVPALVDIDGDGDLDLLMGDETGATHGFRNTGTPTAPAFAGPATNAFGLPAVPRFAAPALADLDGDGDLDALVGDFFGDTVFFANTGTASIPAFDSSFIDPFGLPSVGRDAAPQFADLDADGVLDAVMGSGDGRLGLLVNVGTAGTPTFVLSVTNPFGNADVGSRATPALGDVDGDGDLDAFAGNSSGQTFFFANTGAASTPAFAAPIVNPFGLTSVGGGGDSAPQLADLDADGDLDCVLGGRDGGTAFFRNTGTATAPEFAAPVTNAFGLSDVGRDATPALADLDGDGDLDALIGNYYGSTTFFENVGSVTQPAFAAPLTRPFGLASVGYGAAPAVADLDGDGDLDAVIGRADGTTVFFANAGMTGATTTTTMLPATTTTTSTSPASSVTSTTLQCREDAECSDPDPCTADACTGGTCTHLLTSGTQLAQCRIAAAGRELCGAGEVPVALSRLLAKQLDRASALLRKAGASANAKKQQRLHRQAIALLKKGERRAIRLAGKGSLNEACRNELLAALGQAQQAILALRTPR